MRRLTVVALTTLAMIAFAANSILCRLALRQDKIDPASFTVIRLGAGAFILWLLTRRRGLAIAGNWISALGLFIYAAAFSFAYVTLSAGTGALLLFAAVQVTMISVGLRNRERLDGWQVAGIGMAFVGLVVLLLPGITAPSFAGAMLMLTAGMAWGFYSLRGRRVIDPVAATAGNFVRASPIAAGLFILCLPSVRTSSVGITYAIISGAVTSGLGYVCWYSVLPELKAANAATIQLSAPVIATVGGVLLLGEAITVRMFVASIAVLGGIALALIRTPGRHASRAVFRIR